MSDDFVTGLRGDLVGAMERYERSRPPARVAAALRGRRLPALRAVAVAAAVIVAVVFGVQHLPQPEQVPAKLKTVVRVGGVPVDALAHGNALWIPDLQGRLTRVDVRSGRTTTSQLGVDPMRMAVSDDALWVRGEWEHLANGKSVTPLVRVDPETGKVTRRFTVRGGDSLAAGEGAVWAATSDSTPEGIDRIDPGTGERTGRIELPGINGIATGFGAVWAVTGDGTVVRIDPESAKIVQRFEGIAPRVDATVGADHSIIPEDGGAWVLSTGRSSLLHIRGDRVVQEIGVNQDIRGTFAVTRDGIWVATILPQGGPRRLLKLDPRTGEVKSELDLGIREAVEIFSTPNGIHVLTVLGDVLRVD